MIITETWLHNGDEMDRAMDFLMGEGGIQSINKMRRTRGGGVSILYRPNVIEMKEYRFKRNNHEQVAAQGKLKENKRSIFVIGAYAQPSMKTEPQASFMETISDVITKYKSEHVNPLVIIAGDINNFTTSHLTNKHPTLSLIHI